MEMFKELDSKIVLFGMSCSGKTTFAQKISGHSYLCFDALFSWHVIETFGLSIQANMEHVQKTCDSQANSYILDGWHLADKAGSFLPRGASVYVIWAPYEKIVAQYRVPVIDSEEFRPMYEKWYCATIFEQLPSVRFFENRGDFVEITKDHFLSTKSKKS